MLRSQVRILSGAQEYDKLFIGTFDTNTPTQDDYFMWESGSQQVIDGPDIEYRLNKYGFRSQDFDDFNSEEVNVLFGGDSYTFGDSLPLECIYPYQLIEKIKEKSGLDVKPYSTAFNGSSIRQVIKNTMAFIRKYGEPKYIILMMPMSERNIIFDEKKNVFEKAMHELGWVLGNHHLSDKAKKRYYESFNKQEHLLLAVDLIHMLEDICKAKGIKLIWSTFDTADYAFFKTVGFNNLIGLDIRMPNNDNVNNLPYWMVAKDNIHHGTEFHSYVSEVLMSHI